jgi:hypothetical protein
MSLQKRLFTVCMAASYLLVITASALFHEHHDHHDEGPTRPGVADSQADDDHDCSVCQFLAQKPAPTSLIAPESVRGLVQCIFPPAPRCVALDAFSAWRSRAPPVSA